MPRNVRFQKRHQQRLEVVSAELVFHLSTSRFVQLLRNANRNFFLFHINHLRLNASIGYCQHASIEAYSLPMALTRVSGVNRVPGEAGRKRLQVWTREDLIQRLKIAAALENTSTSAVLEDVLDKHLPQLPTCQTEEKPDAA